MDNTGKKLKYDQITDDLKEMILSGQIQAGEKLQSNTGSADIPSERRLQFWKMRDMSMRNMEEALFVLNWQDIPKAQKILPW